VLLEVGGKPAGYATYRIKVEGSGSEWHKKVVVGDAFGLDARATREIWRFLLEIDWTDTIETRLLPFDHPLLLLTARVNELRGGCGMASGSGSSMSARRSLHAPTRATGA